MRKKNHFTLNYRKKKKKGGTSLFGEGPREMWAVKRTAVDQQHGDGQARETFEENLGITIKRKEKWGGGKQIPTNG